MWHDDEQWVKSQLAMLPIHLRAGAIDNYTKVYDSAYRKTKGGTLLQIQAARTEANTRLRKYVQAVIAKINQNQ